MKSLPVYWSRYIHTQGRVTISHKDILPHILQATSVFPLQSDLQTQTSRRSSLVSDSLSLARSQNHRPRTRFVFGGYDHVSNGTMGKPLSLVVRMI